MAAEIKNNCWCEYIKWRVVYLEFTKTNYKHCNLNKGENVMKWAVLSDLHMNFKNCNTVTARDKLIETLRKENTDGEISFVLITGDCLHQNRGNLKEIASYISQIAEACGIDVSRVILCPGNHDIDRKIKSRNTAIKTYRKDGTLPDLETCLNGYGRFKELYTLLYSNTDDKGYLKSSSLGLLHRYIMGKWYGKDVLQDMTEHGYVVDHMNNIHHDCRISNLEFLKKAYNTAKGQMFDVDANRLNHNIALTIFKDFRTGCYQITIGCNDDIYKIDADRTVHHLASAKLLYDCDYAIVINDAENILRIYETEQQLDLGNNHSCDIKIQETEKISITEEEANHPIIFRNGIGYINRGAGNVWINSVYYDEGWTPLSKYSD